MNFLRYFPLFAVFVLMSCSGGGTKADKDSASTQAAVKAEAVEQTTPIGSDKEYIADKTSKNATDYLGIYIQCTPEQLADSSKPVLASLLAAATKANAVVTGPLTYIYDAKVEAGKSSRIMVSLPVVMKKQVISGYVLRKLPQTSYYRYQSTGGFGQSAKQHTQFMQLLDEQKYTWNYPVLEILSETRNAEMTVVAKSTLLYPQK